MNRILKRIIPERIKKKLYIYVHDTTKPYILEQEKELPLQGKIAVVTGGSGAIGRAICFKLASKGAKVYVSGRSEISVRSVVTEIREKGLEAEPFIMDVTVDKSIDTAFESLNKIDILVNCAGGGARSEMNDFSHQKVSVIDSIINTNLRGTMLCTRQAAKRMIPYNSGKIVVISSAVGIQGKAKYSEYGAAKAGMIGFCRSLALELGEYGINVNCVSPGFIQRGEYNDLQEQWLKTTNCLHTVGTLEDVANAVYFIVSDDAKFITGQNLMVDGGRTLGLYGDT